MPAYFSPSMPRVMAMEHYVDGVRVQRVDRVDEASYAEIADLCLSIEEEGVVVLSAVFNDKNRLKRLSTA